MLCVAKDAKERSAIFKFVKIVRGNVASYFNRPILNNKNDTAIPRQTYLWLNYLLMKINKLLFIIASSSFIIALTSSCAARKRPTGPSQELNEGALITIKGLVKEVENGKDGYTAKVLSQADVLYSVTVSKINLERKNAVYKRFEVGDKVTISGDWWKDAEGKIYITASNLHLLPE